MAAAEALMGPTPSKDPADDMPLTPRPYQRAIADGARDLNTLVVLPTGLGKTLIAALVARDHVHRRRRVLVVAPTRPLVEQHAGSFDELLPSATVRVITGKTRPDDRERLWREGDVLIATPQTARNDLVADRVPDDIGLVVVDEAHRATGNHASGEVGSTLADRGCQVLALTASPGGDPARIRAIVDRLRIEHVEARTRRDPDVAPYVPDTRIEWVRVTMPRALREAADRLRRAADRRAHLLGRMGLYPGRGTSKHGFLKARERIDTRLRSRSFDDAHRRAVVAQAQGMRLMHAVGLLESQGASVYLEYIDRLAQEDRDLARDPSVVAATEQVRGSNTEHPKLRRLAVEVRKHLKENPDSRVLVFAQFRDTVERLTRLLNDVDGVRAAAFVGQGKRNGSGMDQKEQLATLDAFRDNETNVLVSTSVGEEGLDVPSVDLVVFYEPSASEVRSIQRRGRTGRHGTGRVVVLIAKDTSDEAAYWRSVKRERDMRRIVDQLRSDPPVAAKPEPIERRPEPRPTTLRSAGPRVVVDHRELNGPVARLLRMRGIEVECGTLPVADYALSARVVVERKTARDFVDSVLDGRLFEQARALTGIAPAPVIIVEGNPWTARPGVRHEAIAGALAALTADVGITIVSTDAPTETADVLAAMAKREHDEDRGPPRTRHERPGKSIEEKQRFLVEGLPMISATLADRLLAHFGTPRALLQASPGELAQVDGLGPKRAEAIVKLLDGAYEAGEAAGG